MFMPFGVSLPLQVAFEEQGTSDNLRELFHYEMFHFSFFMVLIIVHRRRVFTC